MNSRFERNPMDKLSNRQGIENRTKQLAIKAHCKRAAGTEYLIARVWNPYTGCLAAPR
jgi:hypothetical protein